MLRAVKSCWMGAVVDLRKVNNVFMITLTARMVDTGLHGKSKNWVLKKTT